MINIAIFASGNGTNAENIAKTFNNGERLKVTLVITNRKNAGVISRMEPLGVDCAYIPNSVWDENPEQVVDFLKEENIDLVILAGFMHYVSPVIVNAYKGRILNIHPSLLPAYGGKGMYGHHVHEAVIANGEKESGVTVHVVTDEMDKGEIVMQEKVEITPEDTAETLEAKIHPVEYDLYPRAIVKFAKDLKPLKSVDEQWADALHIPYDKKEGIQTPPPYTPNPPAYVGMPPVYRGTTAPNPAPAPRVEPAQSPRVEKEEIPPMPQNYLLWAVLVTVLCCMPAGIVAIIFSASVSSKFYAGNYEGAEKASRNAQIWIIASFCIGVLSNTLYLPLMLL